ncbi:thymidine kinase [Candidatus Uhrbacteria bacterium]|nr:thymidine kinase [Candidatus Uhrbacteria bacterium]
MFSGKSEELLRRLRRSVIAKKKIAVFKPSVDTRWNKTYELCSRNGECIQALPITDPQEMLRAIEDVDVVGIDELHFFPEVIVSVVEQLRKEGKHVIASGLDMDFRGEPFGCVPQLLAVADLVLKLDAICMICGKSATMTQRLINGKPAPYTTSNIHVGDEEYQARCRNCHEVSIP